MRFILGPPPKDDTILEEESNWHPLNEPSHMKFQITGLLTALLILALIILVLLTRGSKYIANVSWPTLMLLIIPLIPVHELLHAVCFKGGLTSQRVLFGLYPKLFACYAAYNGRITWHRYIIIAVFPFLILTVIPLVVVAVFQVECKYLVEIILVNGMAPAVDMLTIITILKQVPRQSIVFSSGMTTYWKPVGSKAQEGT